MLRAIIAAAASRAACSRSSGQAYPADVPVSCSQVHSEPTDSLGEPMADYLP